MFIVALAVEFSSEKQGLIALPVSLDDAEPKKNMSIGLSYFKTSNENIITEFPELFFPQAYSSF